MDETHMIRYIREIWAPRTHKTHSLLVLDSFKAHATDSTAKEFKAKNTVTTIHVIPGGCTSKIQPLDVSINCPFKDSLRRSWCEYIQSMVQVRESTDSTPLEKIPKPTKQQVVDWVVKAWHELQKRQKPIVKSFKVCGISSCLDGSEDKLVRCGQYITEQMQSEVDEAEEDDFEQNPFAEFDLED